jgi:RHS repeat-associated protein
LTGKYDGNGNLLWETVWLGDLPVAPLSLLGQFYIAPDHLGAPHQITDATGAVAWQWKPDPFGNGDPVGAFAYKLRFPGQFFDQATRLHYNYFRDYDPRLGRYIESDPMGLAGGINTYAYARNAPTMNVDPSGLDSSQPTGTQANICLAEGTCTDHYVACTESIGNAGFSSGFSCGSCLRYCLA